ncbi:MAG: hypothetical protein JNM22_05420 [Saprospiraceae bacterium]|nr:hypothetical protein [Saprospiraceae bacterium]
MGLQKIIIIGFGDKNVTDKETGRFVLPINPENISRNHQINLENSASGGSQHNDGKHANTPSEDLRLEFLLDNTGTVEGNLLNGTPVSKQVEDFLNLTYKLQGNIRKPNFLKILWWDGFAFDCQLTNAQVTYTLFKPDGTPIRAKVNASFKQHTSAELRVVIEDKTSSVFTKVQSALEAGERITSVAQKAFSDASKFLEIARANDLVNFRKRLENAPLALPGISEAANQAQGILQQGQNAVNTAQNTLNTAQNALNTTQNTVNNVQNTAQEVKNVVNSAINLF